MLPKNYFDLPYDLSGSMSKNRFQFELLWGLYHIFEIYDRTEDFVVIFDFVCDVEVFTNEEDSFYQIKTKKETQPYSVNELLQQKKTSDGTMLHSILGKLFLIKAKSDPKRKVKLAVVSNVGLKHNKKEYTELLEQPLIKLDDAARDTITQKLKAEFGNTPVDMENVYYIHSNISLTHPQESLIGKMVTWFADSKGCEVKNPQSLYLSLIDFAKEKADYEWSGQNLDDLQNKKGITKQQFDRLINLHTSKAADGVAASQDWIKQNTVGVLERLDLLSALTSIVDLLYRDDRLVVLAQHIQQLIASGALPTGCEIGNAIVILQEAVWDQCPPDYSQVQIQMLALNIIKRMEENACL